MGNNDDGKEDNGEDNDNNSGKGEADWEDINNGTSHAPHLFLMPILNPMSFQVLSVVSLIL